MEDRREQILDKCIDEHPFQGLGEEEKKIAINAMDQYMEWCCLELLEYMAKNKIQLDVVKGEVQCYLNNGEGISKEELFENFL